MIDPLIALTIIAIYVAAALTIYGLARSEVWQIRQARERFYGAHVDQVTRLERAKETELISTIYRSEKLKALYARPEEAGAEPKLTIDERREIETEIEGIKDGLKAVSDTRGMFDSVCADFNVQAETLHRGVLEGTLVSMVVPIGVVVTSISSETSTAFVVYVVGAAVAYFGALVVSTPVNAFRKASKRIRENQVKLTKMVEATIYGLPATREETPPPTSQ